MSENILPFKSAIEQAQYVWRVLANNPEWNKKDFINSLPLYFKTYKNNCPLCEYDEQNLGNCQSCPGLKSWPNGCRTDNLSLIRRRRTAQQALDYSLVRVISYKIVKNLGQAHERNSNL